MASPITWQNINAPSFGEANRLMGQAQQSILGAFDTAKTALVDSQAFDKELWKRQDQEATQNALSKIYQAQNVDQFNALNQSGALDQAVAANGARIDRAQINALRDGRVSTLQQRELQGLKFGEDKLLLEQAGVTAEGMALAQKQDPVAFNAWLAANPQNRKMADVLGVNRTVQQSIEDQAIQKNQDTRAGNVDARAAELQPFAVALAKIQPDFIRSQISTGQAQANAATSNAATNKQTADLRAQEVLEKRLADTSTKIADLTDSTKKLSSAGGQELVVKAITANVKDESTRARLIAKLPQFLSNPEFANAPAGTVATALLADVNTNFWDSSGNNAGPKLKQLLSNANSGQSPDTEASLQVLRQQRDLLRKELGYPGAVTSPVPAGAGPAASGSTASSPAPATTNKPQSVFEKTPGLRDELLQQQQEIKAGVRQNLTPEIQKAVSQDAADGAAFQATLDKRRAEVAKASGIPVVAKPTPFTLPPGLPASAVPIFLAQKQEEQRRYDAFVKATDLRLEQEGKKQK